MSGLRPFHDDHGGEYAEIGGQSVVDHYGRPERTHLAVRNGVGVTEQPYDVVVVSGDDRVEYVDNVLSNRVSADVGSGTYAFLLDPNGRIRFDLYVYAADDRLLLFLPPGHGPELVEEWRERVFIQDVSLEVATTDYAIITVTGPQATEKLASVTDVSIPSTPFGFVQATMADAGVTIIPTDGLPSEESYDVVCASYDAEVVMDTMLNRGQNAVPFGRRTWETLTLEAGTPLLETELENELPNVTGVRHALDFEKGCFVGQEVVSRIENRGQPNERLVGLVLSDVPEPGDTIEQDGEEIGRITRAGWSPCRERALAMGYVPFETSDGSLNVTTGIDARVESLPFVDGSARSARIPSYPD